MLQKDFDLSGQNNVHRLTVFITADGLFYSCFTADGTLVRHHSYTNLLFPSRDTVQSIVVDPVLRAQYERIVVVVLTSNDQQLAVPDDELIKMIPGLEYKHIHMEKLPGQLAYNYYGLTPHQESLLDELFGHDNYIVHNFLFALTSYYLGINKPMMHLHFEDTTITLYVQKNGILQFYNTFRYLGPKDVLYFTLAACQLTGIDTSQDSVVVSGWMEGDTSIYKKLNGYIKHLSIMDDADFRIATTQGHKPFYYFTHYAGQLCVL